MSRSGIRPSSKEGQRIQTGQEKQILKHPSQFRKTGAPISVENIRVSKPPPEKKKPKKKKKKIIQQEFDNEAEQARLLEEQRRREELDKFRQEQFEKMSMEERIRISEEKHDYLQRCRQWERELQDLKRFHQEIQEWEDYLKCSTLPNVYSEPQLTAVLFQIEEIDPVDNQQLKRLLEKINFGLKIKEEIECQMIENQVQKQRNPMMEFWKHYLYRLFDQINRKMELIAQIHVKNYENYLSQNNEQLQKTHGLPMLNGNNMKAILQIIANKPEERNKYEILKQMSDSKSFKIGIWFNPMSRAGYRMKPVEFPNIQKLSIEIPRIYMSQSIIYKINWTSLDYFTDGYEQYMPISGIFSPECLELVSTAKRTSRWTLKPSFDDPALYMKVLKYPPRYMLNQSQNVQPAPPLVKVWLEIPQDKYVQNCEELFAVIYQQEQWTQQGIEDLKIDLIRKQVSFSIPALCPFMLATLRFVDLPYKSWQLVQHQDEQVQIKIETKRNITLQIVHYSKLVELVQPQDLISSFPDLKGLMEGPRLLYRLKQIGINLIPVEEDSVCANCVCKLQELENQVVQNIIENMHVISFKNCKFNRNIPKHQLSCLFIENPNQQIAVQEDDLYKWKTLHFELDKCALVKSKETNENYNSEWLEGTVSHASLTTLMEKEKVIQEEISQKARYPIEMEFKETFGKFLKMLKLISFG